MNLIVRSDEDREHLIEVIRGLPSGTFFFRWQDAIPSTIEQKGMFMVWCRQLAVSLGRLSNKEKSVQEIARFLRYKFLWTRDWIENGEIYSHPERVEDLTQAEAYHFMQQVEVFAAERAIFLSKPRYSHHVRAQLANS